MHHLLCPLYHTLAHITTIISRNLTIKKLKNIDIINVLSDSSGIKKAGSCQTPGIAMGNAVPELKSVAKYITTNIEEEGITTACKHFNFIEDK